MMDSTDSPAQPAQTPLPHRRLVARVDEPRLRLVMEQAAQTLGDAVEFAPADGDAVDYLVARQPQLVLVHVLAADWRRFVLAAKTSPATRKIPILAVGPAADLARLEQAHQAGCDGVVSEDAFQADPAGLIQRYARADVGAELARQAELPLPELAREAIDLFNRHEFFEQHEVFEALWRAEPGPIRQLYQGLLQVGVAYLQIQRRNYIGARKLFQRARQYLNVLPDVCQGIDVAQFKADAAAAEAELEHLGPDRIDAYSPVFFKPIKMKEEVKSKKAEI